MSATSGANTHALTKAPLLCERAFSLFPCAKGELPRKGDAGKVGLLSASQCCEAQTLRKDDDLFNLSRAVHGAQARTLTHEVGQGFEVVVPEALYLRLTSTK